MTNWRKFRPSGLLLLAAVLLLSFSAPPPAQKVTRVQSLSGIPSDYQKFSYSGGEVVPAPETRGSHYLYDDWAPASLVLAGDSIGVEDVEVRLDVTNMVIEIRDQEGKTRVFPSFLIHSAYLKSSRELIYPRQVVGETGPPGFYSVVYEGKSGLFCHLSTTVRQANYNPALDTGRRWDEIVLNKNYYLMKDGALIELDNRRSKREAQLNLDKDSKEYIESRDIDIRSDEGMVELLKFLDERAERIK